MTGQRILIAEDDPQLGDAVQRGLREEGFECRLAPTAALFLEFVERESPDGLIIDIGLPDADGRDLCHALRARGITAPVVFLTARDALPDRLSGFAAGGDDYLTKPFAFAELVARLRALLRRNAMPGAELVGAGWPHGAIVHDNTLDAYIARLRRKIRAMPGAPELATVHGVGYSLR